MIRKIVIPVRGDGKGDNVIAHAAAIAKRFNSHVVVTHCRPRAEDLLPFGVPIPTFLRDQITQQALEVADAEEQGLKQEFHNLAATFGLSVTDGPNGSRATASWVEETGRQVAVIKRHGRLADLIAVAQPDRDRNLGANTLKAALFNTGRPVMMCPPTESPPATLGERISIAWNGSTEAARAVALTLDLIEKATDVVILTAGSSEVHGATADDLVDYLTIRGVTSRIQRITSDTKLGEALLDTSIAVGADLMIMGAYSDSHERETVFGGNTQSVIDTATMPVVLVH